MDVLLTHDWPTHVAHYGDKESLLRRKPFFRYAARRHGRPPRLINFGSKEVESGSLGSPAAETLMRALQASVRHRAPLQR